MQEYIESSRWRRFSHKLARNPFILFVIPPLVLFIGINRVPKPKTPMRGVIRCLTTLAVGTMLRQLDLDLRVEGVPDPAIDGRADGRGFGGVWLFYVQHRMRKSLLGARG